MRRSCLLTIFRVPTIPTRPLSSNAKKSLQEVHVFGTGSKNGGKQALPPCDNALFVGDRNVFKRGSDRHHEIDFLYFGRRCGIFPHHR